MLCKSLIQKITIIVLCVFGITTLDIPQVKGGEVVVPFMPVPGTLVELSRPFTPAYLTGVVVYPNAPFKFQFLVHQGDGNLSAPQKEQEYTKLIKYFLTALTVPDKDQWVNLSPYEKDRIIEPNFGNTAMGRDLLAQDYLLKQVSASMMYPEKGLGKDFWSKVYERARQDYGITTLPVNTFNKVWIVPDRTVVYQHENTAYIVESHLKVMLEEDYLAEQQNKGGIVNTGRDPSQSRRLTAVLMRELLLPELEREVNAGQNFAGLRQIVSSMILATWYKRTLKGSLLEKGYADKAKVGGINQDPKANQSIYQQYLQAFKKGVYNYIKEDIATSPDSNQVVRVPRKYFAGGFVRDTAGMTVITQIPAQDAVRILSARSHVDAAMADLRPVASVSQPNVEHLMKNAWEIVGPFRRLLDGFRDQLLSLSLDEITTAHFIDHQVSKVVQDAERQRGKHRLIFGFSGTFAGGKTTVAEYVANTLIRQGAPWTVKTFSFDDFLRAKEDRDPWDTEDPRVKFNVERYESFTKALFENRRAVKPMYDQTAKGQLKFGLDEQGRVTIYDGDQELVFNPEGSSLQLEKFAVARDKQGRRISRERMLSQWAVPLNEIQELTLGSMPVFISLIKEEGKSVFKIEIKAQKFVIETQGGDWVLQDFIEPTGESHPVILSQNATIEALEVWEPVTSVEQRDIVVAEGILVLSSNKYFDLSANINVTRGVRLSRGNNRELARGHEAGSRYAQTVIQRGYDEDMIVDALNAQARKERGLHSKNQTHFQINDMSLPELFFRLALYEQVSPQMVRHFKDEGLNVEDVINALNINRRQARMQWIQSRGRGPFSYPTPFRDEELTAQEQAEIYARKEIVTLGLGEFVSLKFGISKDRTLGVLSSRMQQHFAQLQDRTQGLTAGFSLVNFKDNGPVIDIDSNVVQDSPDLPKSVKLKNALLINQLPLMGGVLKNANGETGRQWVEGFFQLQKDLFYRGIIDTHPNLAQRYGLGLFHGQGVVMGVDPVSYVLDSDAYAAIDRIATLEDASLFMNGLMEKYRREGLEIDQLSGYQKRFIGNSETEEDYLALIPADLRALYIQHLGRFLKNRREALVAGFARDWEKAKANNGVRAGFKNEGIINITIDTRQIEAAAEIMARFGFDRITRNFLEAVQGGKLTGLADIDGRAHQQLWVLTYMLSLQENPFDFHYAMIEKWGRLMQEEHYRMTGKKPHEVYDDILKQLSTERGGKLPLQRPWMKDIILKAIQFALTLTGNPDAAMNAKGGIDLNSRGLDFQVQGDAQQIKFLFSASDLAQIEGISGFMPHIDHIKPAATHAIFRELIQVIKP